MSSNRSTWAAIPRFSDGSTYASGASKAHRKAATVIGFLVGDVAQNQLHQGAAPRVPPGSLAGAALRLLNERGASVALSIAAAMVAACAG
jgi:hypothetical protein